MDVQNLYYSARNLYQSRVNFEKILARAAGERRVIRAIAYVVSTEGSEDNKFFDVLQHIGFEIQQKELQTYWGGKTKADWDVGMTIDAVKMADKLDVVVLITGDGDFVPLVQYLQFKGVMVEVMAFGRSTSSKLIEVADAFTDIDAIASEILMSRPTFERERSNSDEGEPFDAAEE